VTMVKAALAAKTPYLNQVYHNYSQSLRLVFNSGKHETEPFESMSLLHACLASAIKVCTCPRVLIVSWHRSRHV